MNIWLVMIAGGVLTYLTRLSFIWLFDRLAVPPLLQRALRFAPPAVLSVIIFQELFIQESKISIGLDNTRLLAALIATGVAWRTHNVFLTIASGMAALLLLNVFLG